jgi:hypothetical protein
MALKWHDNPRILSQAIIRCDLQYFVLYPSVQLNLSDPSLSFYDPDSYMAMALKKTPEGHPTQYVVGHGFNQASDALAACQADFDQWGDQVPPDKMPPPPPVL